jgi:hypothetical protein
MRKIGGQIMVTFNHRNMTGVAMNSASQTQKIRIVQLNLALALIEGLFVFGFYLSESSEKQSAVFMGYSPLRLILLSVVLFVCSIYFSMFVRSVKRSWWNKQIGELLLSRLDNVAIFWVALVLTGMLYVPLFLSEGYLGTLASYRDRLLPLFAWFLVSLIQWMVSLLYIRSAGSHLIRGFRDMILPACIALIVLGVCIAIIAVTGLGLKPDAVYWQDAGVPILLIQVLFAWLAGLLLFVLITRGQVSPSIRLDTLIVLGLWGCASLLWLSQPARPSYTSLEPKAPNFQSYPFGDAIIYDIAAHEYLIGKPIPSEFGVKPLYSLLLAFLHLFSGENYSLLVSIQILVLAAIPALVYLFTVSFSASRPAGLIAAMLVILRERNGIALSNVIEVSHTKLLMSDVFSMGLMALLLWLFFRWFEEPERRRVSLLASGGALGLLSLTRGHPIILAPLICCIFPLIPSLPFRHRVQSILLFAIGVALPLAPWFWRNYTHRGEFAFQDPVSRYTTYIAGLYSLSLSTPEKVAGETDIAYYDRLRRQAIEFVMIHPGEVIKFVTAHSVHNTILSYVYLPHSFHIERLSVYVRSASFWKGWTGSLQPEEAVFLCINICLIALGIGGAWRKKRLFSLLPLVIGIGYIISVSIGRISGWRFIQPCDWIVLIYYSIGLMELTSILHVALLSPISAVETEQAYQSQVPDRQHLLYRGVNVAAFFLLIGIALTNGHQLFSSRAPDKSKLQLTEEYRKRTNSMPGVFSNEDLENFLGTDNAVVVYGEALYPAFFRANTGAFNYYLLNYQVKPYNRVVLHLLGPQSIGVILPMQSAPASFPDAADVIVFGCKSETGVVDAALVLVLGEQPILYTREPLPDLACPLPEAK